MTYRSITCRAAAAAFALAGMTAAQAADTKPVRFILVGDSTMATASGYGDAFCARVIRADTCINLAKGGRSSGSFRAEGRWNEVQGLLKGSAAYRATYVLIQFGHNDQPGKPGRSTDLKTEFPVNMARYVDEVKALGATPVLVTPLTRRSFKDGKLENNLQPWANVIRTVAQDKKVPLLDLNADSVAAVQAMGPDEADTLAVAPKPAALPAPAGSAATVEPQGAAKSAFDYTHVGAKGAAYFARMVEREIKAAIPAIATEFRPEEGQ
ncbi:rhamnogalacturonan acetylesterase [Pseudoduganella plicata]|uniref:Lysophospholipase n=1 Tax=Pseudoduganella plicata TaxID=321984 RepID=A0A4P7BF61_9BURK|nr:rhamnogalacturonan acetylesterase [Pseudoduganella plicata]QBQ36792.1 rhamnogalacturonan acetylesterase [Pseudoduganella plicata]GGY72683.1 lysophospholipase [Pseudoduganella plicata]